MKENFTFEEVVNLIETYLINNDCPWDNWFSEKYCNDCPAIIKKEERFGHETDVLYGYCELNEECRYFGHMVSEKEMIEMWLKDICGIPYISKISKNTTTLPEIRKLMEKYNLREVEAGCYLCNFGQESFCNRGGKDCSGLERCRQIRESEKQE